MTEFEMAVEAAVGERLKRIEEQSKLLVEDVNSLDKWIDDLGEGLSKFEKRLSALESKCGNCGHGQQLLPYPASLECAKVVVEEEFRGAD